MIKDIVVNLSPGSGTDHVANYAISVSRMFGAHLAGIAIAHQPLIVGAVFDGAVAQLVAAQQADATAAAQKTAANFIETARKNGITNEARVFSLSTDEAALTFSEIARRFDLAIVGQRNPDRDGPEAEVLEATLFDSGRPILVVPYIQRNDIKLDRVLVCWDGSRSAARAVGDAAPFLARAKTVEVLIISDHPSKKPEIAGADFAQHIARHARNVDLKNIVATTDVTSTILSHAADCGGDLIVMGGYGHSRLREFVLGGATRGILESMTVPTLMSH